MTAQSRKDLRSYMLNSPLPAPFALSQIGKFNTDKHLEPQQKNSVNRDGFEIDRIFGPTIASILSERAHGKGHALRGVYGWAFESFSKKSSTRAHHTSKHDFCDLIEEVYASSW